MTIDSWDDVEKLQKIGKIVANTLSHMLASIEPGMTTLELDEIGGAMLAKFGAQSAPKLMYNFPGYTCICLENESAHGIPSSSRAIRAGDLINVDVSAELDGYFADTGASFVVPPVKPSLTKLCRATLEARDAGIAVCKDGEKLSTIGKAIEKVARKAGFAVVENLCSHGVGRALHEEPKLIPSYFDAAEKRVLKKGMVITIEPFLSTGPVEVEESGDGWTLLVKPKHRTAQYEHTLIVTENEPIIVTIPD